MTELTPQERIKLIQKALKDCGEDVSFENISRQYKYETGKPLKKEKKQ